MNKTKSSNSKNSKTNKDNTNIKLILIFIIIISLIYIFNYNKNYEHYKTYKSFETYKNKNENENENENDDIEGFTIDYTKFNNLILEKDKTNISNTSKQEVHYLYWTGGYDSTFRLIEMLVNENKIVQPIYVALVLDNDCQSEETCTKLWLRRNRKEEYMAMENIADKIKEKWPELKDNLLKTIIVDEHITDDTFNFNYEKLFYSKNLWPKKRKTHQYLFLSKYAYYHKKPIDIGVLGIHEKSLLAKFLKKKLVKTDDNFIIKIKNHPLTYLRFPLFGRTKEDLLEKAQLNGYDDILKLTWSCWFPKDGKPCEKCPMCKERIVEHPDNKT
jgi:7-cyano-7-deazaguanine synthase in queuosine biosynthesis